MWTLLSQGVLALIMFVVKYNDVFFLLRRFAEVFWHKQVMLLLLFQSIVLSAAQYGVSVWYSCLWGV